MLFEQASLRVLTLFSECIALFGQALNVLLEGIYPGELAYIRPALNHSYPLKKLANGAPRQLSGRAG
jgi:hypothetical protein